MAQLKRLGVTTKFVLTFISILTVSMSFMGYILYYQSSHAAIAQGQILMMQNVLQMRNSMNQKTDMVQNLSQIIAFDPKIQNFLGTAFSGDPFQLIDYRYNIAPILGNLMQQNTYIHAMRIFMTNNEIPEMNDSFLHLKRVQSDPWYASYIHSTVVGDWQGLHTEKSFIGTFDPSAQKKVFTYDRKIDSSNSTALAGVLEIEVDREVLFDGLKNPQSEHFGSIFVVDRRGEIVSNNVPQLAGESAKSLGLPIPAQGTEINKIMDIKGVRSIVISVPLGGTELYITGVFPVSPFIESMRLSLKWIIVILVSSLILLSGVVIFITHALLRRMKVLVKAMKQVREGSLNVSVPVVANDEFSQMAVSFNLMTARIHDLVETVYKSSIMEKEAELRVLESQINPHFLYNTLATISWVARKVHSSEIAHLSNSLAKFYRLVLNKGKSAILVRDEIEMVKAYLEIQKFRFENMFDAEFRIDDRVLPYMVPKNILQPLVENALSHGIEPKCCHGTVIIEAGLQEESIVFRIIDDGVGMTPDQIGAVLRGQVRRTSGSGFAVKNIIERLNSYYVNNYKLELFSRPGIGTVFVITLPKE
uniref:sensor histidine kinase n=1 Tax=Paenibacillus terrae TaxID=159743 RepID=UPI001643EDE8|nr:sensor histidine kinase [Paenibacillus terrae]